MLSTQNTKNRIKNLVKLWKMNFPQEYEIVVEAIKMNRSMQANQYGETLHGESKLLERVLYEIPETLSIALFKELDPEELNWFKSKEGGRWFAKTFKEYSLVQHV